MRRWHVACLLLLCLIAGTAFPGCGSDSRGNVRKEPATLQIVATTGMVADLVRHVGGEQVNVVQLMGEGVDPHLFIASTGVIAKLDAADAIFYSGLHLEGKMADTFERMARRKTTVAVTDGINRKRLLETAPGTYDPHVWFDVALWSDAIDPVVDTLSKLDPVRAEDFRQRGDAYRQELKQLNTWCREHLAKVPPEHRVLVTAHDAFSYFARAYGLEVRAIQGISTESEAGVREINQLVAFLAERRVKAVFVESSVSERNVRALIEGCQAQGHEVTIGGELFSDAMGKDGTPEGTYVGMVHHNVETIAGALH
jgi:manganese/zinc/iron transport system substrate-binding protein